MALLVHSPVHFDQRNKRKHPPKCTSSHTTITCHLDKFNGSFKLPLFNFLKSLLCINYLCLIFRRYVTSLNLVFFTAIITVWIFLYIWVCNIQGSCWTIQGVFDHLIYKTCLPMHSVLLFLHFVVLIWK